MTLLIVVSLLKTALVDELVAEKVVENLSSMSSMSSMSSTNCSSMRVFFCCANVVDDNDLLLRLLHLVAAPLLSMLRCILSLSPPSMERWSEHRRDKMWSCALLRSMLMKRKRALTNVDHLLCTHSRPCW